MKKPTVEIEEVLKVIQTSRDMIQVIAFEMKRPMDEKDIRYVYDTIAGLDQYIGRLQYLSKAKAR